MSNSLRIVAFIAVMAITCLSARSQEKAAQATKTIDTHNFLFHNLVATKSIDVDAFRIHPPLQFGEMNLRALNTSQKSTGRGSAEDDSSPLPHSTKLVPNGLGSIEILKPKTDMQLGFDNNRSLKPRSFYISPSQKHGLSDVK